jgi:hypothetical protein
MAELRESPSGFVARCRCGALTGALDYERTDRRDSGKILSRWLTDGRTVEPRFGGTWSANLEPCRCSAAPPEQTEGSDVP